MDINVLETLKNTYIYNLREQEIIDMVWFFAGRSVGKRKHDRTGSCDVDDNCTNIEIDWFSDRYPRHIQFGADPSFS